ncbi:MAG: hypothetical protein U1E70_08025 [Acetobacteraceae bacterium]|nr:hypothetical protein [Pseudomonadota bacterium]
MQPPLDLRLSEHLEPVPDDDLCRILADAIRDSRGAGMTRLAETYLAGVCAHYVADRLAEAGVKAMRRLDAASPQE